MKGYSVIKRLEHLIHILEGYPHCPKNEIIERLLDDYGLEVTPRTLERDFKALNDDFGIEVIYDRTHRGYELNTLDRERVAAFLRFVGHIQLGDLFRQGLKDFKDLQEAVVLEDDSGFVGIGLIQPILLAIKRNCEITFNHYNYQRKTEKSYRITPFQLREYQGRWYVVGVPKGESHIKTFGLARISDLKTLGHTKISIEGFRKQLKKFDRIIGLNYDAAESREYIELAVSPKQFKYLSSLPIHLSQELEGELDNGWKKISLHLIPNYELKMQLLKLGDQIKILRPKSLQKDIKQTLTQTLKLYSDE